MREAMTNKIVEDPRIDPRVKAMFARAGVRARRRELIGAVHATEIMVLSCPEISRDGARDIAAFCNE
jgi:hypothetical protein